MDIENDAAAGCDDVELFSFDPFDRLDHKPLLHKLILDALLEDEAGADLKSTLAVEADILEIVEEAAERPDGAAQCPFEGNETAWMFQSEDKTQVVVMYYKTLAEPAAPIRILRLAGLDEDALYTVRRYQGATPMAHDAIAGTWALSLEGRSFYGDELMYAGMAVEKVDADFASYIWVLEKES